MNLTYKEAQDEIFTVFKAAWDTTGYYVHYQDVQIPRSTSEAPWAVVSLQHTAGFQATLSGGNGARTFTRVGFLTVKIFTPSGKGLQEAYDLAKVVSDAFEGVSTPKGVWFKDTRLLEVGVEGEFHQLNVVIDFTYDEVK